MFYFISFFSSKGHAYIPLFHHANSESEQSADLGGQQFQADSSDNGQTTIGRCSLTAIGQEELGNVPSSQRGFIASNSDNLFHPMPGPSLNVFCFARRPFEPPPLL